MMTFRTSRQNQPQRKCSCSNKRLHHRPRLKNSRKRASSMTLTKKNLMTTMTTNHQLSSRHLRLSSQPHPLNRPKKGLLMTQMKMTMISHTDLPEQLKHSQQEPRLQLNQRRRPRNSCLIVMTRTTDSLNIFTIIGQNSDNYLSGVLGFWGDRKSVV